ncbi:MAG: hemin ABC transporter substrate-binding protein [Chthoniobacterales bacterium]
MRIFKKQASLFAALFLLVLSPLHAEEAKPRLVSGSGTVSEIICALGAQDQLVAVDVSSIYPEELNALPKIGYARTLSTEGILAMRPTLLFVTEDAGPPPVIEKVKELGVNVITVSNDHTPEAAVERILSVGEALNLKPEAEKLAAKVKTDLEAAQKLQTTQEGKPKVMFIYARGGGVLNVSGTGTSADAMITLAGGQNAVTGYEGYKPLTAEAVITAAPDFILLTSHGLQASGGVDAVLVQPGISQTPAGKAKRIISMDDLLLLGFGPRLGEGVSELSKELHPAESEKKTDLSAMTQTR